MKMDIKDKNNDSDMPAKQKTEAQIWNKRN